MRACADRLFYSIRPALSKVLIMLNNNGYFGNFYYKNHCYKQMANIDSCVIYTQR
jgi:hypothetical protein|tara:strand:+ start:1246 stop:1410 length:165 start_codon:yes stop_codon:yes gene_type:complete